ncbi:MAG TPA: 16S rRNA (cytosine(1402)-N(4))-methyltransferase RsmH [Acidimicrobiales bacterium]|nr:16S rRNA (cytosine(1402)-N(4))-methyltransferase RsmH [Acidimicrobiales bacterium]
MTSQPFEHEPVMVEEVVDLFAAVPAGTVVDATTGGAGHARAILDAHPHVRITGLDQDPVAVAAARERLAPYGERAEVIHARFDRIAEVVAGPVSGVLFDLGVSSVQLDVAERGFSHRFDAPLDMRMDTTSGRTAADIVNGYDEARLARMLREHGDERFATRIAKAIVANRPIDTTGRLVEVIRDAIPAPARRKGGHPATRSFQAVRIEVNDELDVLPVALDAALALLAPGGRCAVLAYHSGEDRIVKSVLRDASTGGCTCPPSLPCACGATPTVRLLKRGAWKPTADEIARNPRAESARLRAVEKLEVAA